MKRKIAVFVILTLMAALALSACQKARKAPSPGEFLSALTRSDFAAAYEFLSPKAKEQIDRDAFVNRYELMVRELGITGIYSDSLIIDHQAEIAEYNLHYALTEGELSYRFKMPLVKNEDDWLVEWSPALVTPDMDWGDTLRVVRIRANRGEIFSGDDILAQNAAALTVFANTTKIGDQNEFAQSLAPLIGESESYVLKKLERSGEVVVIKSMLPDEVDSMTTQDMLNIPGVGIDRKAFGTIRVYPFGQLMGHTLGYVGTVTSEELARLNAENPGAYSADSVVGKSGLELAYESELRGKDGREYYIADKDGKKKTTLYTIPAQHGLDLHLNVDVGMQKRLEDVMQLTLASHQTGAAIAMSLKTGKIKALASYPGFDPNAFVRGISQQAWEALNDEANRLPLFNRLTRGLYPPGSVLKPFTAACYLESGAIDQNTSFTGEIVEDRWTPKRSDWVYPAIKRVEIRNRPPLLNLNNALITSDNIFFAYGALETGSENFLAYMDKLGMNEAMPFELRLETPHIKKAATEFNIKFLADSGYGQGEVLITPIQMAAMFTALDKGDIMLPHIVDKLYRTDGNSYTIERELVPQAWKTGVIQPSTLSIIKPSLEKVITDGTGYTLNMRGRQIAGKTGTAQVGDREVSWFAAYALDREDPLLAIVVIDTDGSIAKFDIVRELLEYEGGD